MYAVTCLPAFTNIKQLNCFLSFLWFSGDFISKLKSSNDKPITFFVDSQNRKFNRFLPELII